MSELQEHEPVCLTAAEARALTDQIKRDAETLWDKVTEAYLGRAHTALGYDDWDSYCITEFGSLRLRIPREERVEMVRSLQQAGMSNRAVASTLGVSEGTVRNDQKWWQGYAPPETDAEADELTEDEESGAQNYAPTEHREPTSIRLTGHRVIREPARQFAVTEHRVIREPARQLTVVTGRDGKQYASSRPQQPKPQPSTADTFEDEMSELDRAVDSLSHLVSRATDTERAELAARWADELADYGKRLAELFRNVTPA